MEVFVADSQDWVNELGVRRPRGGPVFAATEPPFVVIDWFENDDETLLENHTPDVGDGWEPLGFDVAGDSRGGSQSIENNRLRGTSDSVPQVAYRNTTELSSPDYAVTCNFQLGNIGGDVRFAGVCARLSTTGTSRSDVDGYLCVYQGDEDAENRGVRILRLHDGNVTELAFGQLDIGGGTLRFEVTDAAKTAYVNDVEICSTSDNTVTQAGRAGVGNGRWSSLVNAVNWFRVSELPPVNVTQVAGNLNVSWTLSGAPFTVRRHRWTGTAHPNSKTITHNPYAHVDWDSAVWAKGNMHCHTSDGSNDADDTLADMVDTYHDRGFTVLAITDHDHPPRIPTYPWTDYGRDPEQLGMLAVKGNEFSNPDHVNGFFADMWNAEEAAGPSGDLPLDDIVEIINQIGVRGGVAQFNHPGRYSRSDQFYIDFFTSFAQLQSIEVYNSSNRYPADLPRWERLLTLARALNLSLPIWGMSVDDAHATDEVGTNYNVFLLDALDEQPLRNAMQQGASYFVWDPDGTSVERHVNGNNGFWHAAPVIDRVETTGDWIELEARHWDRIEWRTDGGSVIASGERVQLRTPGIRRYLRATLYGEGAVTQTQPFYLEGPDV